MDFIVGGQCLSNDNFETFSYYVWNGGISALTKKTHLKRESLYRMLSMKGNPEIKSIFNLLHALGLKMTIEPENLKSSKAVSF